MKFCWLLCLLPFLAAQEAEITAEEFEAGLNYQQGTISLGEGLAVLEVGESFRFLGAEDTEKVIADAWGNPPGIPRLGMLFPASMSPLDEHSWAVIISYEEEGHVKDDEAADMDYDEILTTMKKDSTESNDYRRENGYPTVDLVGWAEEPHYDSDAHKVYWAKELKFEDSDVNTLNYDIRVLGRQGVLVFTAVANITQLGEIKPGMEEVLTMASFQDGHRYADFNPSVDKVAAYGIGGLIAGKLALKAGFFKGLIALLLAGKKFVILAVIGIGAFVSKLLGRNKEQSA